MNLCIDRFDNVIKQLEQEELKRLELHSAALRATLTPLSCSPSFPRAQYRDIRTLTHELIVNYFNRAHTPEFTSVIIKRSY